VQTTLLGAAIAIILALVTALVGPLLVDWGRFRDTFEARANRLTGLEVRFAGPIEVHILPTPTLKLQAIEIRRPGEVTPTRARSVQIEFALDALMRGSLRAANVTVDEPELAFGLDRSGRFDWLAPTIGFDPDAVSIDHLAVEHGHVVLSDAASGASLALEKFAFSGDVRSLAGPAKGDGSFEIAGHSYPYRISAGRPGADGAVKLHLLVDPVDQPRMADLDGSIWLERGVPQFEATVQWAHGFGRSAAGASDPWRITGHVRGSTAAAAVEKLELQYGPEEHAARLHGDANLTLGQKPELAATLATTQIDLDRLLALPEAVRRKPLAGLRSLGDRFSGLQQSPIPMRLAISAEAVTLAGAALQRLSGEVRGEAGAWTLESLDFRAPGATQIRLRGRLNITPQGVDFAGPARIEARDPRALVAWLTDRSDAQAIAGTFRAEGDVRLGTDTVAIDRLKAELDRVSLEGRFAYAWPRIDRPARIEAALSAPEVDFDRAYALVQDMFAGAAAGTALEWPREGTLALNVARSSVAGVAVQSTDVSLRFDAHALDIERLAIADFGGASVAAKGNVDVSTRAPRGTVTLDLDVRTLDGVIALLEKVSPQAAAELRRSAPRFVPARLRGSLAVDAQAGRAAGTPAGAKFKVDGAGGSFAITLQGEAGMADDASTFADFARLGAAKLDLTGRLEAQDGGALIALLGLDRLVAVDKGSGRLDLKAAGAVDDPMAVEARITAGGLDVSVGGSLRLPVGRAATAGLALKVAAADLRTLSGGTVPGGTVPASLTARLDLADDTVTLSELAGRIAGADIGGRLAVGLSQPTTLDGDIRLGKADLPALIAAAVGIPGRSGDGAAWPAEPFGAGLFAGSTGRIAVAAVDTVLTPKLSVRDLHGILRIEPSKLTVDDLDGTLAGGTISGRLEFQHGPDGLVADSRVRLRNVEMAGLMPGDGRPLSGRLSLDARIEGSGRSPVALMGSLRGGGTFTAEQAGIARLDPRAFAAVIASVDGGLPIESKQLGDRLDAALGAGALAIPRAEGMITIAGGAARLVDTIRTPGAELAISADVDLGAQSIDATLRLGGPQGLGPADIGRPEIAIALQGPADGPRRTLDVTALTSWLSSRAIALNAKRLEAAEAARNPAGRPQQARPQPQVRPDTQATLETQVNAEPPAKVEPLAKVETQPKVETQAKAEIAPKSEPQVRLEPQAKVEPPANAEPLAKVEPAPPEPASPAQPLPGEAVAAADPAINSLDQVIAANPNDAAALSRRGQLFVLRGNFPFAIRDFNEVLRLRPKDAEAFNNRCWARAILGDLQTALRDCNEALSIRPSYADALDSRGFVNLKIGQPNGAIADYDAALRINPKQASSLYGRGMAKLRTGRAADGQRDIAAAKALQANIADEFATLGIR
jgi:tetratricopeptide (TPR) repeat protein